MASSFDPYRNWLGVSTPQRPVDHYQLLGLARFEADSQAIVQAAQQRLAIVACQMGGPYDALARQLTAELTAAQACLLDPQRKAAYDDALHLHVGAAPLHVPMRGPAYLSAPPIAAPAAPMAPPAEMPDMQFGETPGASANAYSAVDGVAEGEESASWNRRTLLIAVGGGVGVLLLFLGATFGLMSVLNRGDATSVAQDDVAPAEDGESPPPTDGATPIPPPPAREIIQPNAANELLLTATAAELHGPDVQRAVQQSAEVVTNWTTLDNWLTWHCRVNQPGVYKVEITYSATSGRGECELEAEGAKRPLYFTVRSNGTGGQLTTEEAKPIAFTSAGETTFTLRARKIPGDELLTLASIRLIYDPTFGGR